MEGFSSQREIYLTSSHQLELRLKQHLLVALYSNSRVRTFVLSRRTPRSRDRRFFARLAPSIVPTRRPSATTCKHHRRASKASPKASPPRGVETVISSSKVATAVQEIEVEGDLCEVLPLTRRDFRVAVTEIQSQRTLHVNAHITAFLH